jgi:hypothetical protein
LPPFPPCSPTPHTNTRTIEDVSVKTSSDFPRACLPASRAILQVFEVELIDWKSVKDILGDGGVIKTVVREGVGWSKPQPADEVCAR